MNITSRQLRAFLLVAQHGCFSRAAERMFISQSGISIMVRELESQLGCRLFHRTTRTVKLTAFGSRFLPIATRSLSELESAAMNIRRSSPATLGTFLVSGIIIALDLVADCLPMAA